MLGDISNVFVQMLQQLRTAGVRFGFISDARGMDVGTWGRSEFATLTALLDDLLRVRGAIPDFWLTWGTFSQGIAAVYQARHQGPHSAGADTVLRTIEWYGVEKKEAILVSSTAAGLLSAGEAGITGIHYFGMRDDRPAPFPLETNPQSPYPSETIETRQLGSEIQRILKSSLRASSATRDEERFSGRGPDPFPGAGEA